MLTPNSKRPPAVSFAMNVFRRDAVLRCEDAAREVVLHCGDALAHTAAGMALYDWQWGTFSLDAEHNERVVLCTAGAPSARQPPALLHECRARHSLM